MDREYLEGRLEGIRQLLSHLHGEITSLDTAYTQVLSVLRHLEVVALRDDLTGLLRRNSFFGLWQKILDECQALGTECGVLIVDIDHFKKINDTFGHDTGDAVITRVAELLRSFEGPRCAVGRLGGEEFVIALQGSSAETREVAERIRVQAESLRGPVPARAGGAAQQWAITLSVGVATTVAQRTFDATRLLKAADTALYEAKTGGRNRVRTAA